MRKLITIACLAALGGCAIIVSPEGGDFQVHTAFDRTVEGDGVIARDARQVGSFQRLQLNGPMIVDVRVGPAPSLVVEADSNLLPLIHTDGSGDSLRITTENIHSRNPIHVTYTVPRLAELHANGTGRTSVTGLSGGAFEAHLNGSGTMELAGDVAQLDAALNGTGRLDAARLRAAGADLNLNGSGNLIGGEVRGEHAAVALHGSGHVQAHGAVHSLTVRVSGSGDVELEGLASDRADLVSSGSGSIYATVHRNLMAQATGSGPIRVRGNPMERSISGNSVRLVD
jgi:hypothetical protein